VVTISNTRCNLRGHFIATIRWLHHDSHDVHHRAFEKWCELHVLSDVYNVVGASINHTQGGERTTRVCGEEICCEERITHHIDNNDRYPIKR